MKRSIVKRTQLFTAVVGILVAVSGFVHAGGAATAAPHTPEKLKNGSFKISRATDAGGVTLDPGEYEVKPMRSPAGPVIRFTRVTYNPIGIDWVPLIDKEIVGEVPGRPDFDVSGEKKGVLLSLAAASSSARSVIQETKMKAHKWMALV